MKYLEIPCSQPHEESFSWGNILFIFITIFFLYIQIRFKKKNIRGFFPILALIITSIPQKYIPLLMHLLVQVIMKDKWMNMGFEEEELKPYIEPVQDWQDQKRIDILQVSTSSQWCSRRRVVGWNSLTPLSNHLTDFLLSTTFIGKYSGINT